MALTADGQALMERWRNTGADIGRAISGEITWDEARRSFGDQVKVLLSPPEDVKMTMIGLGGVPTLMVEPEEIIDERALFYIHGGGYVHGAIDANLRLAANYAKKLKARVYMPDYRQAPEYQFPQPILDTFKAYKTLLAMGQDPKQLVISGDSAGGAMIITIMRWARDAGAPMPVAGVAISPWADLTHSGPSVTSRADTDPLCGLEFLEILAKKFLGDALPTDPDASPIFADMQGLSPVLIQMGENEVMLSGGITLAERLAEQRVRVTLEVWPEMFHVWHQLAGNLDDADEALENAAAFLNRELERAARQAARTPKSS